MTTPSKPTKTAKAGKSSQEAVLSRARRLMRAEKRKLWDALKIEGDFTEAAFDSHVAQLSKIKESSMTDSDRAQAKLKALEEENADLKTKLISAQGDHTKTRQSLQTTEKKLGKLQVEHEIREMARSAGFRDLDYAVHLYRDHLRKLPESEMENPPAPTAFFDVVKKDTSKKYLFSEEGIAAGPKSVAAEKAERADALEVGATTKEVPSSAAPTPPKPGTTEKADEDISKLKQREFADRTFQKYGFRPSANG